jgi:hypothetical protein
MGNEGVEYGMAGAGNQGDDRAGASRIDLRCREFWNLERACATRFTAPKIIVFVTQGWPKALENKANPPAACSKNGRICAFTGSSKIRTRKRSYARQCVERHVVRPPSGDGSYGRLSADVADERGCWLVTWRANAAPDHLRKSAFICGPTAFRDSPYQKSWPNFHNYFWPPPDRVERSYARQSVELYRSVHRLATVATTPGLTQARSWTVAGAARARHRLAAVQQTQSASWRTARSQQVVGILRMPRLAMVSAERLR